MSRTGRKLDATCPGMQECILIAGYPVKEVLTGRPAWPPMYWGLPSESVMIPGSPFCPWTQHVSCESLQGKTKGHLPKRFQRLLRLKKILIVLLLICKAGCFLQAKNPKSWFYLQKSKCLMYGRKRTVITGRNNIKTEKGMSTPINVDLLNKGSIFAILHNVSFSMLNEQIQICIILL